jgi:glycosyltransferase involved in cell wall biosynthesis
MKVLVVNNAAPFIRGGAELLAEHLVDRLTQVKGVDAELVRVPFRWEPADRVIEEILINRHLRLYDVDRVIGLKFPAYLLPHPDKTLWVLHQYRQAYDLYESGHSHISRDDRGRALIEIVRRADNECFRTCHRIYTNSPVTRDRMQRYNGFTAEVLYPPLNDPELFTGGDYGSYIFAGGRVGPAKRQHLLVEAMHLAKSHTTRLLIAGPADTDEYVEELKRLIARYELGDRVDLRIGFHERRVIANYVNNALACACLPYDEDSLSYVAMEAFSASKAVLTTTDSGGLLEIVRHEETGLVVAPEVRALADGLERLSRDAARTRALGEAARAVWTAKDVTWEATVKALLR